MFSAANLIWGMIFGLIGSAHFIYGKKRSTLVPMLSGAILFIMPYFISNLIALVVTGIIFVLLPFFLKF